MDKNRNTLPTKGKSITTPLGIKLGSSEQTGTVSGNTLVLGMLIGGMMGMALGAFVTLVARMVVNLASSVVRRLLQRGKGSEGVDFRWLLQ